MPTGTVLFITSTTPLVQRRQLVEHAVDPRQVGVAGLHLGGVDADEDDPAAREHVGHVERERHPAAVALEQAVDARLVDRGVARLQRLDPAGVDVAADDLVPQVGEAGRGDQADVADADHAHRTGAGAGAHGTGFSDLAMAIISALVRSSRRVLVSQ